MRSGEETRKGKVTCPAGSSGVRLGRQASLAPRPQGPKHAGTPEYARALSADVQRYSVLFDRGPGARELRGVRAQGGGIRGWEGLQQEERVGVTEPPTDLFSRCQRI